MTAISNIVLILILKIFIAKTSNEICFKDEKECKENKDLRYLFYDVNPPEGFNLRRDVYMRMAILANKLNQSENNNLKNFQLVLPPWSHLMHWQYQEVPEQLPWGLFFDLPSLKKFAPVIEMYEFFDSIERTYTKVKIDEVYVLQHFEDMFESGKFEEKLELQKCRTQKHPTYFYYGNLTSLNVNCLFFHGSALKLIDILEKSKAKTILIDHAEIALHDYFGGKVYWQARRSMRFNLELRKIAEEFRMNYLNSNDIDDNTVLPDDWRDEKPKRNAKGGPYLAVHLRRKDFLRGRPNDSPTLQSVNNQIVKLLNQLKLTTVFLATDSSEEEYNELHNLLPKEYELVRFKPTIDIKNKYRDGGVAIIDQIICSYARYFIGTHESTFSFRIQEEREILGFAENTTFNSLCKDSKNCKKPSVWNIVY